jgi:hypothetical protein
MSFKFIANKFFFLNVKVTSGTTYSQTYIITTRHSFSPVNHPLIQFIATFLELRLNTPSSNLKPVPGRISV